MHTISINIINTSDLTLQHLSTQMFSISQTVYISVKYDYINPFHKILLILASGSFFGQKSCRHKRISQRGLLDTILPTMHLFEVLCAHEMDTCN